VALEIRLDLAHPPGLAAECPGRMQERVVVQLLEGLQLDAESLAIIQQPVVVIGNAPRAGIEIKPFVELAFLRRAAQFGVSVAAAQRPVAATCAAVELEHLHLVTGLSQLQRRRQARQSRAQDEHRRAFRVAF